MQTDLAQNSKPAGTSVGLALISQLTGALAENKPGIQTTEFAVVAFLLLVDVALTIAGKVPSSLTVIFGAFSAVAYQWLRNNRKNERESSLLTLVDTFMSGAPALFGPASSTSITTNTQAPVIATAAQRADSADPASAVGGPGIGAETAPLQPVAPAPVSQSSQPSTVNPNPSSVAGHASLSLLCLLSLFVATLLTGCAALAKFQADPRVQFAEQEALKIGVAALQQYSNGGNFDSVWGISEGLYAVTDTISALSANKSNADANNALAVQVAQTIQSYASTGDTKALAGKIAAIITKANPQTDAQRVAVVNSIAGSLQTAATVATPASSSGKAIVPTQVMRGSRVGNGRWQMAERPRFRLTPPSLRTLYSAQDEPIYPVVVIHQD